MCCGPALLRFFCRSCRTGLLAALTKHSDPTELLCHTSVPGEPRGGQDSTQAGTAGWARPAALRGTAWAWAVPAIGEGSVLAATSPRPGNAKFSLQRPRWWEQMAAGHGAERAV